MFHNHDNNFLSHCYASYRKERLKIRFLRNLVLLIQFGHRTTDIHNKGILSIAGGGEVKSKLGPLGTAAIYCPIVPHNKGKFMKYNKKR
jgi:hypothetical protein